MTGHTQVVAKEFLSKRSMVEFLHFLETDRALIEFVNGRWQVTYHAERTTVTLPSENMEEVVVTS